MDAPTTLIALLGAHAYFDYAGQGDFMARAKNQLQEIPGVPWYQVLGAHGLIHGAAVAIITGIWWLCLLEMIVHIVTDNAKCFGRISYNADQAIHVACKLAWFAIWLLLP